MKNPKRFCTECGKELAEDSKLEVCEECFGKISKGFSAATWKINKRKQ